MSARLEVEPIETNDEAEIDYVHIFNEFGRNLLDYENRLHMIVNHLWPEVL